VNVPDWKAAVAQARKADAEPVPPGWKTARQIAEECGVAPSNVTARIIGPMLAAGSAESRAFRIATPSGTIRQIPHYRLIAWPPRRTQKSVGGKRVNREWLDVKGVA
jgi:hypothetical protein